MTDSPRTPVSLIVGRFQPPHPGHFEAVRRARFPQVICIVNGTKTQFDLNDNPLTFEEREKILRDNLQGQSIVDIIEAESANFTKINDDIMSWTRLIRTGLSASTAAAFSPSYLSEIKYRIGEVIAGDDRIEKYAKQIEGLGLEEVIITGLKREEIEHNVSASDVRDIIRNGPAGTIGLQARFPDDIEYVKSLQPYLKRIKKPYPAYLVATDPDAEARDIFLQEVKLKTHYPYEILCTLKNPRGEFYALLARDPLNNTITIKPQEGVQYVHEFI